MGNAIAMPRSSGALGLPSREELQRSLANASMSMPVIGGDKPFLKMDKGDGSWLYGQEETQVEEGSLWAVNPYSLQHGFIAWKDDNSGVEDEVMMPIGRALPAESTLKPVATKTGWQRQQSVELVCISGEDEGTVVLYKQSSVGAMKLFASLTNALLTRVEKGEAAIIPVIEMQSNPYKHKTYGRIYNPIFDIKEWREPEDTSPANVAEATSGPKPEVTPAGGNAEDSEEERKLAEEYQREQAQAAAAAANGAPRRRARR